ncbi:hypothetical protein A9495_01720 [Brachyspira hampsonii]|uniref:hypothetical protein n=2 Tax=Brachyspira hampsonii TaxID=1287055 RepID=UPI000851BD4F|nr:hypothetical protein [Brachyspira hampsonii]OEJ20302.1 hypothetical protein A9495_01720 [Brachyspira hampsonii]
MDIKTLNVDANELLKIKTDLENILNEMDRLAGEWINISASIKDVAVSFSIINKKLGIIKKETLLKISPKIGLAIAAGTLIVKGTTKIITEMQKNKKIKETLPILKETANIKIPIIKEHIETLEHKLMKVNKILTSDIQIKLSENNIQNKDLLINGINSSFTSYCTLNHVYKTCQYVLDTYYAWLNDKLDCGKSVPNINQVYYESTLYLYNNSYFKSIITSNPSFGSLLIINNNDNPEIEFIPTLLTSYALTNNNELYNFIFNNRKNENLKESKLINTFKKARKLKIKEEIKKKFINNPIILLFIFIVTSLTTFFIEKNAYGTLLQTSLFTLAAALIATIIFYALTKLYSIFLINKKSKFDSGDILKSLFSFIIMILLIIGSTFGYNKYYNVNYKENNIINIKDNENNILKLISNKDFENAYNKNSSFQLLNKFPIVDIKEGKTLKNIRKELYNNMATNFFNNMEYIVFNEDMDYDNYNYISTAYENRKKYYTKIIDKDQKEYADKLMKDIPEIVDNKRHQYLLSQISIIENLIEEDKKLEARKAIFQLEHLSDSKLKINDEKKLLFFGNTIEYKKYWEKERERLSELIK